MIYTKPPQLILIFYKLNIIWDLVFMCLSCVALKITLIFLVYRMIRNYYENILPLDIEQTLSTDQSWHFITRKNNNSNSFSPKILMRVISTFTLYIILIIIYIIQEIIEIGANSKAFIKWLVFFIVTLFSRNVWLILSIVMDYYIRILYMKDTFL